MAKPKTKTLPRIAIEYVAIEDLRPDPDNPREIEAAELAKLREAVTEFGLVLPVVANRRNKMVIGGHQRITIADELEEPEVPVVWVDLPPGRAKVLNLALNRISGAWDLEALAAVLGELDQGDRLLAGFDPDELATFNLDELGGLETEDVAFKATRGRDPEAGDPPDQPQTQPGDVWRLGDHLVVCADTWDLDIAATIAAAGEEGTPAMVLTDPPYAIFGSSTGVGSDVSDDRMVRPFFEKVARRIVAEVDHGAHVYVHCDWRSWSALWEGFRRGGLAIRNMLVWHKPDGSGAGTNYSMTHELIAFAHNRPNLGTFGDRKAQPGHRPVFRPNVLQFARPRGKDREHNAAKPVDMLEELILNSSDEGAIVWDLFGGSGSTLIAAENVGRRSITVEMEPDWCDVIVDRWRRLTGKKGRRLAGRAQWLPIETEAEHGDTEAGA